ncbi:glycosyltransferase [Methylobacterium sp. sgz302541]|uniref:glycosyltransferase n=1 Tax=unclassified Methylobacterium TaxID=2615210 RepID=UPI003D334910
MGRLDHAKDHQTLLHAFAKVRQPGARLVILGEGVEYARLEAEIDRLGLSGQVELRGYVMEPWPAFAEASCLVLSSRVEAFGLAVVEALAHGMPVVATDCDGPREILLDPALGVIVPVGDATKMAEAIEAVLEDPGDAERRRRRAADFSPRRAATAYDALFEAVVERDRSLHPSLFGRHGT